MTDADTDAARAARPSSPDGAPDLVGLARYPGMTGWFQPTLLARLLRRVIVSETFGWYADRRLIVAALDTAPEAEHVRRARAPVAGEGPGRVDPDEQGAIWIDYVADLGDGFDATFAVASLLAQERLDVGGHATRRGGVLLMGGDEVYPDASDENYRRRLVDPYAFAFPDPDPASEEGPSLYAIPGNHDWYDGLVSFLALFTREGGSHLGGWRTRQRRSYFAVQVAENWWVWGLDAQLADRVDQPQADYFAMIARAMPAGSNLILLAPEPGWIYAGTRSERPLGVIDDVAAIAIRHCRGARIPLVLSGDRHHYSRYVSDDGATQFVTSGGGGAYLHPTHDLVPRVAFAAQGGPTWLDAGVRGVSLARAGEAGPPPQEGPRAAPAAEALFPDRAESLRLLEGALAFPLRNPGFAGLWGLVWLAVGALTRLAWPDSLYLAPAALFGLFFAYARHKSGARAKVAWLAALNALVHAGLVLALAIAMADAYPLLPWWLAGPRASFALFCAGIWLAGATLGAWLVGFAFYALSRWTLLDHDDAFAGMRLDSHRHFLRLRIDGEEATLYAIRLERTPRRGEWRVNAAGTGRPAPAYVAEPALAARLIEPPVTIRAPRPAASPLDAPRGNDYPGAASPVRAQAAERS